MDERKTPLEIVYPKILMEKKLDSKKGAWEYKFSTWLRKPYRGRWYKINIWWKQHWFDFQANEAMLIDRFHRQVYTDVIAAEVVLALQDAKGNRKWVLDTDQRDEKERIIEILAKAL